MGNRPTSVRLPGSTRTDFPDGSYLIEGRDGEKIIVSETGAVNAHIPKIERVEIQNLATVLRHEIACTQDTTSHTLHFAGGGVFSYLHHRSGSGMSIQGNCIAIDTRPGGIFVVVGTTPEAPAAGVRQPT
ncbi:hypothetical protein WJ542_20195 [Paraburkholderia sp. B3]|uniref:hypothetical protein n=1 Tax=Paraburkholderia sp. B3 TaxID=3134791 RepID=UPI0039828F40